MPKQKFDSRTLRGMAEDIVGQIVDDGFSVGERADLVTSLVRQWATYDGHAAMLLGENAFFLELGHTPLGRPSAHSEPGPKLWLRQVAIEWNVDLDDLVDVRNQLNRGQSAEVVTSDGLPLRLSVNPSERKFSVEPLGPLPPPLAGGRDYHKIAMNILVPRFAADLGPKETEALAASVARQWQRFDGHACLLVGGREQIHFKLTEEAGGGCHVQESVYSVNVGGLLGPLGVAAADFPSVIARLNLGETVEYRTPDGVPSRLWQDPRDRAIRRQPLDAVPAAAMPLAVTLSCPKCSAFVSPFQDGNRPRTCPLCGHVL